MLRGIYTGASGMSAMQVKMDTVANNLANVDKTAFKEDVTIFKANPEVLIHRTRDDGVGWVPMGGFDVSPLVGKLGTGSEVNEIYTRFDQGALKRTERDQDVAINGDGFFVVQSQAGPRLTRSGAFILDRNGMLVTPDGHGFVYIPGPRFCACGRVESDCDQSRASCPKADPASGGDDETDIIIAGRQVPFVQVGMIVHPDDCLNCERDGSPLWCSALVCDIHDDDETARFGMMATLLFRNGERREEPCDELRRRWRLARDFDQGRVYTGRWGAIPRGSVWPVAEVNEDA